jgi:agmatinase
MSYKELYIASDPLITYLIKGKSPAVRILGVPFDYTSCYRPGSRFAPNWIRTAFQNIEIYSPRLGVDMESESIEDLGNLKTTANLDDMIRSVERVTTELLDEKTPLCILGGEHSITFASFGALLGSTSKQSETGFVIFDAHLDLRDEYSGLELSHATFLRRLIERRKLDPRNVFHVGTRGASKVEWEFARDSGMNLLPSHEAHDLERGTGKIKSFAKNYDTLYLSYDLDAMDPAYVPGVGTPEPFGLSPEEVLSYLYALKGSHFSVFDIVELAVPYDAGGITAAVAAKLLNETACVATFAEKKRR